MRIISKFRDYYDIKDNAYVDKTIVFDRKDTGVNFKDVYLGRDKYGKIDDLKLFITEIGRFSNYRIELKPFIVGFCGKTYLIYKIETTKFNSPTTIEFLFDINRVEETCASLYKSEDYWSNYSTQRIREAFEKWDNRDNTDMFFRAKSPIFLISENRNREIEFETCPELGKYEFYKKFSSFLAFQEIQSYISGVLGLNSKPITELTDKDKIISNGFDTKTSFRNTEPPKRKQK